MILFPTLFTDENLEYIYRNEVYFFTNDFFRISPSPNFQGISPENNIHNLMVIIHV